jgi:TolB-like protein
MNFLAELKRRNVIRMAGLYLVGAWLIVQVAATLLPVFEAPGWVMKTLVALLVIGFIPALVVSWVFELTPEGLKRDSEVANAESIAPQTARRMDRMLLVVMALGLSYVAIDKFVLAPGRLATAPTAATAMPSTDTAAAMSANPAVTPTTDLAPAKPIVRGIAVLPFDNLSPDPNNAFFAGGVCEEVLTKLSRIAELRVISRTSMERIAEDKLEVGAIGARLGVSHVLEGSVRKAGEQIRVTVQLIEAATDNHVWAENYDRKLDDVFAIQSEIAIAIANQLKLSLSPELQANLNERPTQNQAAYALYLRAIDERRIWRGSEGFKAVIDLLEPAVAADPGFLRARVMLADAYGRVNWQGDDLDGSYANKARQAVADLVQRSPEHPQSRIAQGQLLYNLKHDYAPALKHFEAARAQLPGDGELLRSISGCLKRLGQNQAFLETAQLVAELDPESQVALSELELALLANRRLDEAVTTAERALERFPSDQFLRGGLMLAKLARDADINAVLTLAPDSREAMIARFVRGDIDALLRPVAANASPNLGTRDKLARLQQIELLQLAGRDAEATALLASIGPSAASARALAADSPTPAFQRAMMRGHLAYWAALSGETTLAREYLRQAQAKPANDDRARFYWFLSASERRLGHAEAAWQLIQPYVGSGEVDSLSHGELRAFKSYYDKVYGEAPSYRAYVAKIAGEKK